MRRKLLFMSPELIADALKNPQIREGFMLRSENVPGDMRIVGAEWNPLARAVVFVVESDTFEIIGELEPLPHLFPIVHQSRIDTETM